MTAADETDLDERGPIDYLVVEFPQGHQNFTGEMATELARRRTRASSASSTC